MKPHRLRSLLLVLVLAVGSSLSVGCKGTGESYRFSWSQKLVEENSPVIQAVMNMEPVAKEELETVEIPGYRNYVPPVQYWVQQTADQLLSIDQGSFSVLTARMRLGQDYPLEIEDPTARAMYASSAQAALSNAKTGVERYHTSLSTTVGRLREMGESLAKDLAVPVNPKSPETTQYATDIAVAVKSIEAFAFSWQSLVVIPVGDTHRVVTEIDATDDFDVIGAIAAAQEKLDVVLDSIATLSGKKYEFDAKHTIYVKK